MLICSIKHFFCYQNQKGTSTKFCARNISIPTISYTIIIKKEQAINLCQKYFNFYDPLYYNNQKGTRNNFVPEIFNSYHTFYYNKQKGTSNKFVLEIFKPKKFLKTKRNTQQIYAGKLLFFIFCNRHAVKHVITLCVPKLLYFFYLQYIKMSGKTINFNDKKILKSDY